MTCPTSMKGWAKGRAENLMGCIKGQGGRKVRSMGPYTVSGPRGRVIPEASFGAQWNIRNAGTKAFTVNLSKYLLVLSRKRESALKIFTLQGPAEKQPVTKYYFVAYESWRTSVLAQGGQGAHGIACLLKHHFVVPALCVAHWVLHGPSPRSPPQGSPPRSQPRPVFTYQNESIPQPQRGRCLCHSQSFTFYFSYLKYPSSSLPLLIFPSPLCSFLLPLQTLEHTPATPIGHFTPEHPWVPFPQHLMCRGRGRGTTTTGAYHSHSLMVVSVSSSEGSHWTKVKLSAGRAVSLWRGSEGESVSLAFQPVELPKFLGSWLLLPSSEPAGWGRVLRSHLSDPFILLPLCSTFKEPSIELAHPVPELAQMIQDSLPMWGVIVLPISLHCTAGHGWRWLLSCGSKVSTWPAHLAPSGPTRSSDSTSTDCIN